MENKEPRRPRKRGEHALLTQPVQLPPLAASFVLRALFDAHHALWILGSLRCTAQLPGEVLTEEASFVPDNRDYIAALELGILMMGSDGSAPPPEHAAQLGLGLQAAIEAMHSPQLLKALARWKRAKRLVVAAQLSNPPTQF